MELIPTQEEVLALLRRTGGLRAGYFEYPNGLRTKEYLQVALAMRDFQTSNILCVALSRKLRSNTDLRAMLPKLSIVAPATGGLPVAYGVAEALRASKVYWAERQIPTEPLHFRQFLQLDPGEKVVLVDDIFRTGSKMAEMKQLVESAGGEVVAMAVIVKQPAPNAINFGKLPFYSLADLEMPYVDSDPGGAVPTKVRL
ncbi:MAG: phosphoribosyltransferase family protein [Bryobacteraceae bacterium]